MSSSRRRGAFALLVRVAVFALIFVGVCEVWFRVVMPASVPPNNYQRRPATMYRFDPYSATSGLITIGRLCRRAGTWHINQAGWNSDVGYVPRARRDGRPVVALVGDSYIEGYLTDTDEHVDAYLPKMLPGTDAYAFGVSAWNLEQYVAASRYARERFQPTVLVIFVNEKDVRDSLRENCTPSPYWWQIASQGTSFVEVPPTAAFTLTPRVALAKKSALIDYLRYNAQLDLPGVRGVSIAQPGGDSSDVGPRDRGWEELLPAAGYMVGTLCEQNPDTPIIFAWDDGRRYMSPGSVARAPLLPDGRAIRQAAGDHSSQCYFLDLRSLFAKDWAAHGVRFEAADGGHWNAYANRLIAREIADLIESHGLLLGVR